MNPSSLRAHSLFQPPNTLLQLLTPTSDIFSRPSSLCLPTTTSHPCSGSTQCTPPHSQWISNVLLHVSWANRAPLAFKVILWSIYTILPLDAMLNHLLAWCTFLSLPIEIEKEAMKIHDKSCDISCFSPSSYSQYLLLAIAWNRSYADYPRR